MTVWPAIGVDDKPLFCINTNYFPHNFTMNFLVIFWGVRGAVNYNICHKMEVGNCFLVPVDLNPARNSLTIGPTQRQEGNRRSPFSAMDTGCTSVWLLEFSSPHDSTGCLIALALNHLRTFKEVLPFEGLPRLVLARYFISQFSLHYLFHLKFKPLLSAAVSLKQDAL